MPQYNPTDTWDGLTPDQIQDRINRTPELRGLFTWVLSGPGLPEQTTLAMIKALNAATRAEIVGDKRDCWAGGNYVNNIGSCITDPDEALNKAFRDIGNLQDSDNVRKARIEAFIANRYYSEINEAGDDEDAIQAILDRYMSDGFYATNRWIVIGGQDGTYGDGTEDPEQTFEDYVNEVGEGVANTAKGLYDELGDKITECVGSPIDCIKKIGTAILDAGGIPEECVDMPNGGTSCGTADSPERCWKDCVNFNLPGLPIPNIPLPPGVVDVGTYRDFENAVKTVGKTIGDIIDGNESCGPKDDQECTVGQVLEDLGEWARREWEEAIGGIDDATGQDVIDWLKGILGDVTAGIIWADIEEEVTNVLTPVAPETKECPDPANPGQTIEVPVGTDCPPVNDTGPSPQECSNQNRTHVPGDPATQTPSSCGDCLEGFEEVGDQCQEGEDPFTNNGPTASECTTENREFNPATDVEDSSCGDCLSGFKESGDACVEDTGPDDGDGIDCNSPRPSFDGSFDSQFAGREWDRDCSATNCPTDGSLISEHPDNDCSIPIGTEVPQVGEPCDSNGDGQLDGEIDENGECVAVGGPDTPPEEEECAKPDGTPTGATASSGCEQCPDGYTFDFGGICQPDGGSIDCAQYNREANEDGTCGGCLPGYVKDTSLPNEPCVKIFDGCPPGFELVNGECTAVACPEGQAYCESSGQCEEPQNCPGGPSEGGGGGGGGGGGFGLNLDIAEIGISGDPQLLGRQRFGQQDFLTPLFTGNQDNGADFPIARFLQGKGDIV